MNSKQLHKKRVKLFVYLDYVKKSPKLSFIIKTKKKKNNETWMPDGTYTILHNIM